MDDPTRSTLERLEIELAETLPGPESVKFAVGVKEIRNEFEAYKKENSMYPATSNSHLFAF